MQVTYSKNAKFNLMSLPALMKIGWALEEDKNMIILKKGEMAVKFAIVVHTPKGMLFLHEVETLHARSGSKYN